MTPPPGWEIHEAPRAAALAAGLRADRARTVLAWSGRRRQSGGSARTSYLSGHRATRGRATGVPRPAPRRATLTRARVNSATGPALSAAFREIELDEHQDRLDPAPMPGTSTLPGDERPERCRGRMPASWPEPSDVPGMGSSRWGHAHKPPSTVGICLGYHDAPAAHAVWVALRI